MDGWMVCVKLCPHECLDWAFIQRVLQSSLEVSELWLTGVWALLVPAGGVTLYCQRLSSAARCYIVSFFPHSVVSFHKCRVTPLSPRFRILFHSPTETVLTTASLHTSLPSSRVSVHKSTCSLLLCLFPTLLSDSHWLSLELFDTQNHSNWPAPSWSAST